MTEESRETADTAPDASDDARKAYEFSGLQRLGTLDKVTQTGGSRVGADGITGSS